MVTKTSRNAQSRMLVCLLRDTGRKAGWALAGATIRSRPDSSSSPWPWSSMDSRGASAGWALVGDIVRVWRRLDTLNEVNDCADEAGYLRATECGDTTPKDLHSRLCM